MDKKFYNLLLFCSINATTLFSQGFIEITSGYSIKLGSDGIVTNQTYVFQSTNGEVKAEKIKGSYGQGINLGLKLGYMFSPTLGFDLNTSYLFGPEFNSIYSYTENGSSGTITETGNYAVKAKMLRFNPSIILSTSTEKIIPYAKLGIVLGIGTLSKKYDKTLMDGTYGSSSTLLNGGLAIGASAELGLQIPFTEKLSFVGALNFISMSYSPTKGTVTARTENGVDILPSLNTNEKETVYQDSYSYTDPNPDPNSPNIQLKEYYPFGSVGINIGLRLSL